MFAKPLLTIDSNELAAALGIPKSAILRTRAGLQDHPLVRDLPPPLMTRPRLVWLRVDIEAWIESRRTFRPETATPAEPPKPKRGPGRGPGRPRKAAQQAEGSGKFDWKAFWVWFARENPRYVMFAPISIASWIYAFYLFFEWIFKWIVG